MVHPPGLSRLLTPLGTDLLASASPAQSPLILAEAQEDLLTKLFFFFSVMETVAHQSEVTSWGHRAQRGRYRIFGSGAARPPRPELQAWPGLQSAQLSAQPSPWLQRTPGAGPSALLPAVRLPWPSLPGHTAPTAPRPRRHPSGLQAPHLPLTMQGPPRRPGGARGLGAEGRGGQRAPVLTVGGRARCGALILTKFASRAFLRAPTQWPALCPPADNA